jgi:hypothetical protein
MLVTFSSASYANITMFGDIATTLIKAMGHSGIIPGAVAPEDLLSALGKLKNYLKVEGSSSASVDLEDEDPITLYQRALPLIELLESSIDNEADVLWEYEET